MKIASASIQMQSAHLAVSRTETSERLQIRTAAQADPASNGRSRMPPFAPGAGAAHVALSREAIAASESEALHDEIDALDHDPRMRLLRSMIEFLTGHSVRVFRMSDLGPQAVSAGVPGHAAAAGGAPPAGSGVAVEYDFSSTRMEFEHTAFQASGIIRTTDGQEIQFELAFEMQRAQVETTHIQVRAGEARLKDPLVLDFGGPAAQLSDLRFAFDLDADGQLDAVPLLDGGRGFLAIDRNDNGRIDDGRELFGPTSGDGFAELAALDTDGNGWIDEADPAFAQLRIWRPDANGNGTLQTLAEANVGAFYLGRVATPFDLRNAANETLGQMRTSSIYVGNDGRVGSVSQIDLSV